MKTPKEIEQLAEQYWAKQPYDEDAYVVGYTQCQEDMVDKKYDEEHMLLAYVTGRANTDEDDKEVGKMRENFNRLLALIETRLNKK